MLIIVLIKLEQNRRERDVASSIDLDGCAGGGRGTSSGSIDIRTMSAIILRGSFSTRRVRRWGAGAKRRAFLKFHDYATINQIFISWQTENCVPTPDHTGGLNLFF